MKKRAANALRSTINASLRLCKAAGLFALSRRLTRQNLRVLCYHGFALEDEDRFRPSTFLSADIFARRMRYLKRQSYPVLPLTDAMRLLDEGRLPANAVTVTIDDGFFSTHAIACQVLAREKLPSTLYLTSYYFTKGTPIFQLAVSYICWKSSRLRVDLSGLGIPDLARCSDLELDPEVREWVDAAVHRHGSTLPSEEARESLARAFAARLDVDYDAIVESRKFSLINAQELRDLTASGMAIELHTHRHRFPEDRDLAACEIAENRAAIEPLTGTRMTHFCYPSGLWRPQHLTMLEEQGIQSATTCVAGLAAHGTDRMLLPRILDDSRVSMIEFEAEISGFMELVRLMRRRVASRTASAAVCIESFPLEGLAAFA